MASETSKPDKPTAEGPVEIGYLNECPACGCRDLFTRKDFPQKIGLILVVGAVILFLCLAASRRTFYIGVGILALAAAIDAALYLIVPRITVCYRCGEELRDHAVNPRHEGFELAVAEKYRRQQTG